MYIAYQNETPVFFAETMGEIGRVKFIKFDRIEECDFAEMYDGKIYVSKEELDNIKKTDLMKTYENAVQEYLDKKAQERGYDNTYTCLSYLFSTDETWRTESNSFNEWRDKVWKKCHEILGFVISGQREIPTIEELISQLPEIDWNSGKKTNEEDKENNQI